MATLPENLIATAEVLVSFKPPPGSAGLRRAVSTAYYALFSRLAALSAGRLARSEPTSDSFKAIYRAIEHGHARKVLASSAEFSEPIGEAFERLQEVRHWADYSLDTHPESDKAARRERFSRAEAAEYGELARQTIVTINALSNASKQRLAVGLVARTRR
jgi:uncharacterized protein (UPF0332 family)